MSNGTGTVMAEAKKKVVVRDKDVAITMVLDR
jgi:hypothetical protein